MPVAGGQSTGYRLNVEVVWQSVVVTSIVLQPRNVDTVFIRLTSFWSIYLHGPIFLHKFQQKS